jgi:hypothetical protein
VRVEGEVLAVPKAAAGEYQWQIDAGMGVRTAQPAAKEHHRLIEERAALLVDVAELVKEVAENTTIFLSDADKKLMHAPDSLPQPIKRVQTKIFTNFKAGR